MGSYIIQHFLRLLLCLGLLFVVLYAQSEPGRVRAQLFSESLALSSVNSEKEQGQLIGLRIELDPGWHLSWDNYDSKKGEPSIQWDLPIGFGLEPLSLPKPEAYSFMGLESSGYKDTFILLYRLIPPPDFSEKGGEENIAYTVAANIRWLLCKDICIPGESRVALELSPKNSASASEHAPLLNEIQFGSQQSLSLTKELSFEARALDFGLIGWLGLAFLGGLILNLMPCVLPVLSIKLMSLFESAHSNQSKILLHALMYALGTVSSFIILALVLFTLRSLGESVGWGFHLQDPYFITFLIALFFLIGMNLLGFFEVGLSLLGIGGRMSSKNSGALASLGTGILATVAGAPCVGPFVGGVSGLALQADLWTVLTVFGFMGLGMAAPFLICAAFPNLLKCLPKPGAWMQVFRQFMGIMLVGSSLFLIWVVKQSTGTSGFLIMFSFLGLLSFSAWIYGRWGSSNYLNPHRKFLTAFVLIIVVLGFIWSSQHIADLYSEKMNSIENRVEDSWAVWSEEAVEEVLNSGQLAFIDFTASWCLVCQSNKALVLRKQATEALFKEYQVIPFTADWTLRNPEITRALESHQRSGVPLYLILSPDGRTEVLPQNLSHSIIEARLSAISNKD